MSIDAAVILDEDLQIPAGLHTLSRFRRWTQDDRFPERGRIDYLDGDLEVDSSPEDIYTHGVVKTAIAAELHSLVVKRRLGNVLVDSTRVVCPTAGLSVEPDVVVVLWKSLKEGRVREVPAQRTGGNRFIEFEGAPDLVVEIISDRSVRKDRDRLPPLYAQAAIPELWLVDARGEDLLFAVHTLGPSGYVRQRPRAGRWLRSPLLNVYVRLTREVAALSRWSYELESKAGPGR
jgi:Uma2 family endonuclease